MKSQKITVGTEKRKRHKKQKMKELLWNKKILY